MPRKDRRFTADDILRFYCANLTPMQKALVDAAGLDSCGGVRSDEERVVALLRALTTRPLSRVVRLLPGGNYISQALEVLLAVAEGDLDIDGVELIPGEFLYLGREFGRRR